MQKISLTWDMSDGEYALLQALVVVNGREGETLEAYAARVAFKGLRGLLAEGVNVLREKAVTELVAAFDAADTLLQDNVLDMLGFARDGVTIKPKPVEPSPEVR